MPEPTSGVANVLRAAYYYAITDGLAVVDGAVLLVAAARNDDRQAMPVLGRAVAQARAVLTAPDTPTPAATAQAMQASSQAAALREARWWVLRDSSPQERPAFDLVTAVEGGPSWGADVCRALRHATDSAAPSSALGMPQLLTGLLTDPGLAAQRLAALTGLNVEEARSAAQTLPPDSGEPFIPLVDVLTPLGAVDAHVPWPARWVPKLMSALTERTPATGGPVLTGLPGDSRTRTGGRRLRGECGCNVGEFSRDLPSRLSCMPVPDVAVMPTAGITATILKATNTTAAASNGSVDASGSPHSRDGIRRGCRR